LKRKIFSALFALVLLASFSLVTAVPAAADGGTPAIDGTESAGEWDGATVIDVDGDINDILKVLASTGNLYMLLAVDDSTDNRIGEGPGSNDKTSVNINPTDGASYGMPCDIIFEMGTDPSSWADSWGPSCGTIDGYETNWVIDGTQQTLPEDLEAVTIYDAGRKVTEWKIPLSTIGLSPGDTLQIGGNFDIDRGNTPHCRYPVGLDWAIASTYAEYSLMVENQTTGLYYQTIQDAIDTASGTTLVCAPGIYNEDVSFPNDKDGLTLLGANAGVPAGVEPGARGAESTILGKVLIGSGTTGAGSITIDGFTINSGGQTGIYVRGRDTITISNNIIDCEAPHSGSQVQGVGMAEVGNPQFVITDNTISNGRQGIFLQGTNTQSSVVSGNDISHFVVGIAPMKELPPGNTFTGNRISDATLEAISINHDGNVLQGNTFMGSAAGVRFYGNAGPGNVVESNIFADNDLQVEDLSGNVNLELILGTNTFDRAVVVRGSGIKVPAIFSSIQDAVDEADSGDTVSVAKGTYDEVVAVNESVNLLGANAGECAGVDPGTREAETIVNAFHITVDDVVIDGFQINGAKVSADATNAIVLKGGTSGHTISNNILPGPGGTPPAGTDRGIVFGYDVSSTTVSCNEIYGWKSGIYINPTALGSNLLFQYNSIHHNWAGIGSDGLNDVRILHNHFNHNVEGFGSSNVGTNVGVHFNNFCGNTTAIAHYSGQPIDATNNWWCDPSGPHASPGYGDPVSGNVLYDPWLLELFVPGAPPPTTFDRTLALNIGWTLVSTDSWIDAASVVGEGVVWALNYTPSLGWFEVDPAALVPVDALYLKMVEGGGLGFDYSGGVPVASSKDLEAGWNLISSATLTNARAVLSPLRYVQVGNEQGVGLATLVSQGNYNQHSQSFYLATLGPGDWNVLGITILNPFDGYWVYMNAGKSFGVVPGH